MAIMQCYRFVYRPNPSFPDNGEDTPPTEIFRYIAKLVGLPVPEKWVKAPSLRAVHQFRDKYKLRTHFLDPLPLGGASGELDIEDGVHAIIDERARIVEPAGCDPEEWKAEIDKFLEAANKLPKSKPPSLAMIEGAADKKITKILWYRNHTDGAVSLSTLYTGHVEVPPLGWAVLVVGPHGVVLCAELCNGPLESSPAFTGRLDLATMDINKLNAFEASKG